MQMQTGGSIRLLAMIGADVEVVHAHVKSQETTGHIGA
jgi:hypothetical protein